MTIFSILEFKYAYAHTYVFLYVIRKYTYACSEVEFKRVFVTQEF